MSEKTISVKVSMPVWRAFSDSAKLNQLTVSKWLEQAGRIYLSTHALTVPTDFPKFEPVVKRKTGLNPAQGEIPTRIVELLKTEKKLAFAAIVDSLEPLKSEHRTRTNIRNAILRLCGNGTLTINESRIVRLAKGRKS